MSHHLDVGVLTAMAGLLGSPPQDVLTVRVPARELGLGTSLSAAGAAFVDEAVDVTLARLRTALGRVG
jgi:hypothetical protein